MISYDAMVTEVTSRLGNRQDIGPRMGRWINYAFFEILLNPRFMFFELDDQFTFLTANGTSIYNFGTFGITSVLWHILNVRDTTNARHLTRTHHQVIDRIQQTTGQPVRYYRYGNTIVLDPIPDNIYSIFIRFRHRPNELSSGTTFEGLGTEWEEPIVTLAAMKGFLALEQPDKAAMQKQLLDAMLQTRQDVPQLEDHADSETTVEPTTLFRMGY